MHAALRHGPPYTCKVAALQVPESWPTLTRAQEDVAAAVRASAEAAAESPGIELRRGKLIAMADAFSATVNRAVEDASAEALGAEAAAAAAAEAAAAAAAAASVLPDSILANREPYLQGDWRKEPYIPRRAPGWLGAHMSTALLPGSFLTGS